MATKIYAGIGARETPPDVCKKMSQLAYDLRQLGYFLYSGGAIGADQAFERGASNVKMSWRPEHVTAEALELARKFHPNWNRCSPQARKLLARNGFQILGKELDTPVDFVICYTLDGKDSGGTGQALRIARHHGIPVFNLKNTPNLTIPQIMEQINV